MAEKQIVLTADWGGAIAGQVATVTDEEAAAILKAKGGLVAGTKEAKDYLDKMFKAEQGIVTK